MAKQKFTRGNCSTCGSQRRDISLCLNCGTSHNYEVFSNRNCTKEECTDEWHNHEPADYLDLVLEFAEAVSGSPWGQKTPMASWPLTVIDRTKELIAKRDKLVGDMLVASAQHMKEHKGTQ